MRYALLLGVVWAVVGCANPNAVREAADRCAEVGISARDPEFAFCTQSYRLEAQQASISNAYRNAVDTGPRPRRATHCTDTGAC